MQPLPPHPLLTCTLLACSPFVPYQLTPFTDHEVITLAEVRVGLVKWAVYYVWVSGERVHVQLQLGNTLVGVGWGGVGWGGVGWGGVGWGWGGGMGDV